MSSNVIVSPKKEYWEYVFDAFLDLTRHMSKEDFNKLVAKISLIASK